MSVKKQNPIRSRFRRGDGSQSGQSFEGVKSLTQQHHAAAADINDLYRRHRGAIPASPMASRRPIFGDFTSVDYQAAMNVVADARQRFAGMPKAIQKRFESPLQVIRFCENPANLEEAIKLGFLERRAEAPAAAGSPPKIPTEPAMAPTSPAPPSQGGLPNGDK